MKIYIAGKITDIEPEVAYEAFLAAENHLLFVGHTPLNPMKIVDQTEGRTYNEYLADALMVMLTEAEGVYFIDGWGTSRGARIEMVIAQTLDIPIYFAASQLPVGSDWTERVEI